MLNDMTKNIDTILSLKKIHLELNTNYHPEENSVGIYAQILYIVKQT